MKIYLYKSHLGSLYLSMRDDLDYICYQCGDSDRILEEYDIDEYDKWGDDILPTIKDLLNKVMFNGYMGVVFNHLINDLKNIIKDLYLTDNRVEKDNLLGAIKHTRKEVIEQILSFVDTIEEEEE